MGLLPYTCGCASQGYIDNELNTRGQKCICANVYRNVCSKGPEPCSASFELNLNEYVENSINDSETFELVDFPADGFSAVTVTSEGVLNATTDGIGGEEYVIRYRVKTTYEGVEYAAMGYVYLCFKNLCKGVDCEEGEECDNCTGECVDLLADLEV